MNWIESWLTTNDVFTVIIVYHRRMVSVGDKLGLYEQYFCGVHTYRLLLCRQKMKSSSRRNFTNPFVKIETLITYFDLRIKFQNKMSHKRESNVHFLNDDFRFRLHTFHGHIHKVLLPSTPLIPEVCCLYDKFKPGFSTV